MNSIFGFPLSGISDLKIPALVGDHVVMQRYQAAPNRGCYNPGMKVTASLGDRKWETTTGDDGKWSVKLDPLEASAEPVMLIIEGSSKRVWAE